MIVRSTFCAFLLSAFPALAEVPRIITDIPAVDSLVQQVMGDLGQPQLLLPQGGNPHDYQLTPKQAGAVQEADLLVWVGPALTPWLDRVYARLGRGKSLALMSQVDNIAKDVAADHDHGHDHGDTDPHLWLDPQNAISWLGVIAETLAELDADNAATYRQNAKASATKIADLNTEIQATLAPYRDRNYAVMHDAYGYFTDHYGMRPAIAVALGDGVSPSASRLREIRAEIAQHKVTCAFPEVNHDPKLIQVAIEGTSATLGSALDPAGVNHPSTRELYGEILQQMAKDMVACLAK